MSGHSQNPNTDLPSSKVHGLSLCHFASGDSFLESKQNYSRCISRMEQTCFPAANQSSTSSLTHEVSFCPTKSTANGMTLQGSCPTARMLRLCHHEAPCSPPTEKDNDRPLRDLRRLNVPHGP